VTTEQLIYSIFWTVQKCSDARRAKNEPRSVYIIRWTVRLV